MSFCKVFSLASEVQLAPFLDHHSNWQLAALSSNESRPNDVGCPTTIVSQLPS
ncbi:hypothetical protein HBI15_034340 [Parastagonospora nodorum]|nr:hypothetical protein HBI15_034340 [Parastagonospora nodorum]